jgi:heme-degrading monooxygenase HmoA
MILANSGISMGLNASIQIKMSLLHRVVVKLKGSVPLRHPTPCCDTIEKGLGPLMFVVIWQFEISEEKIAGFEAAYSAQGAWAQLFRTSPDYLGTELLRDAYIPGNYLTIDRWASEEAFRAFRKDHDQEYETLDRTCDSLTARETRIGAYTV